MSFICVDIIRLPVLGGVTKALLSSLGKHFIRSSWVISGPPGVSKQLGVVHQIVLNQVVSIFRGDSVISRFNRSLDFLAVLRPETTIVGKAVATICLLHCGILIVVTLKFGLSRLEDGVGLGTVQNQWVSLKR